MPCELSRIHLHAYLDGELDAAGAASFERHLQSCTECASALSSGQSLRQTLVSAQLYERAPGQLRQRVQSNLPAGFPARTGNTGIWQWAAIAATLLLAGFLGRELLTAFRTQSENAVLAAAAVDAHMRSLQPGHLTDVQSSDQHTVKPWFDGKINFAPPVLDFVSEGFPLLGGRIDVLAGRTAAALVYGRRKHVINVFVLGSPPATKAWGPGERNGYHWFSWQKGGYIYIAVSDVAANDLQELRDLFLK